MAKTASPRPTFTLVMGCSGVGKTMWERSNWDLLPNHFFNELVLAGGIGDWNKDEARSRARLYINEAIDECLRTGLDFGMETAFTPPPARRVRQRAAEAGYRINGFYLGAPAEAISSRLRKRNRALTGHHVHPSKVPSRLRSTLGALLRTAGAFDSLTLLDNTAERSMPLVDLPEQCRLERGKVVRTGASIEPWCERWLMQLGKRKAEPKANPAP